MGQRAISTRIQVARVTFAERGEVDTLGSGQGVVGSEVSPEGEE